MDFVFISRKNFRNVCVIICYLGKNKSSKGTYLSTIYCVLEEKHLCPCCGLAS